MTNPAPKLVTVITGTRADYGLMQSVYQAIDNHPQLTLEVLITGMHLLRSFGYTAREVIADGWTICDKVKLQSHNDNPFDQSIRMGRAISAMTRAFRENQTDIVLVLGDRLEMFAAAAAATASRLVLAHIHGGDIAPGIQDDAYRHAISKLAHIHFAASKGAAQRLMQMGENPQFVHNTGSPAIDNLKQNIITDSAALNASSGIDVKKDYLVVLQHPAGHDANKEYQYMKRTLKACRQTRLPLLIIYPNCDTGYPGIVKAIEEYCCYPDCHIVRHLPRPVFLGLVKKARTLVGNSSCGIIEAGRLNTPVINIGPRQNKREHGDQVINCEYNSTKIFNTLTNILKNNRLTLKPCRIYGTGGSGRLIADILARTKLTPDLRHKLITY